MRGYVFFNYFYKWELLSRNKQSGPLKPSGSGYEASVRRKVNQSLRVWAASKPDQCDPPFFWGLTMSPPCVKALVHIVREINALNLSDPSLSPSLLACV